MGNKNGFLIVHDFLRLHPDQWFCIADISRQTGLSRPTASTACIELAERGYIHFEPKGCATNWKWNVKYI
jgi:DNA-binding IclR family transcriptional regulator